MCEAYSHGERSGVISPTSPVGCPGATVRPLGGTPRTATRSSACSAGTPRSSHAERDRRAHEREVGERLREVADLAAGGDVVLLGEQPHVVGDGRDAVEGRARLLGAAEQREGGPNPRR